MTASLLGTSPDRPASAAATRARRPSWRDPRLGVGLALVCLSVLGGARVLATADDTVSVLAARGPLAAGERLDAADLVSVQLRFASESDADRYLPGDTSLAAGTVLLRPVGAGELVPRAAVSAAGGSELVELPLAVDPGRVPATVTRGAVVDVWVAPAEGSSGPAELLLPGVPVLASSRPAAAGASGLRHVVVGVPAERERELGRIVSRLGADSSLLLLRRPG